MADFVLVDERKEAWGETETESLPFPGKEAVGGSRWKSGKGPWGLDLAEPHM